MSRQAINSGILLALIALVSVSVSAQERREVPEPQTYGSPALPADAAAIHQLVTRFKESWAEEDADTLVTLHSEDTEWINAYARIFRGAASLGDFLEHRLFAEFDASIAQREAERMKRISTRYLGDDAAVVHLYTDSPRGGSRRDDESLRRTHIHFVLEKRDDAWRIVHTVIMDAR